MLERDDFQQRYQRGRADRPPRVPLSADAGLRLGRGPGRRRARRDRPDLQPAGRARPAARRRPGGPGRARAAAPRRDSTARRRCRKASGITSASRSRRRRCTASSCRSRDDLMLRYYDLLSRSRRGESGGRGRGDVHPMEAKKALAHELVARFHGAEAGRRARRASSRRASRSAPANDPVAVRSSADAPTVWICQLLKEIGFATSTVRGPPPGGAGCRPGRRGSRSASTSGSSRGGIACSRSAVGAWRRSRSSPPGRRPDAAGSSAPVA